MTQQDNKKSAGDTARKTKSTQPWRKSSGRPARRLVPKKGSTVRSAERGIGVITELRPVCGETFYIVKFQKDGQESLFDRHQIQKILCPEKSKKKP